MIDPARTRIVACETLADEIRRLAPPAIDCRFLAFGLHVRPDDLHAALQAEIDAAPPQVDTVLFGYGMCARGTVGLEAGRCRLVIPRTDDCIALFLGSRAAFLAQHEQTPGTFYLTRGWIECGDDPYTEYLKMAERRGPERAYQLEKAVIAHYTRLALIYMGGEPDAHSRAYARHEADFFGLEYEEIAGSDGLLRRLIHGPWDDEFVVVEPGQRVEYSAFYGG